MSECCRNTLGPSLNPSFSNNEDKTWIPLCNCDTENVYFAALASSTLLSSAFLASGSFFSASCFFIASLSTGCFSNESTILPTFWRSCIRAMAKSICKSNVMMNTHSKIDSQNFACCWVPPRGSRTIWSCFGCCSSFFLAFEIQVNAKVRGWWVFQPSQNSIGLRLSAEFG